MAVWCELKIFAIGDNGALTKIEYGTSAVLWALVAIRGRAEFLFWIPHDDLHMHC